MNEQYMRLRKEWHEANERVARFEARYNDLLNQSSKVFDIRNNLIDEVAECEAFLERLDAQQRLISVFDDRSHFYRVSLMAKARAYDRLVNIAKSSSNFDSALYHARHNPKYLDED